MTTNIPDFKSLGPQDIPWARAVTEFIRSQIAKNKTTEGSLRDLSSSNASVFTAIETQAGEIAEVQNSTGTGPTASLGVPTAPILESGLTAIAATWDGQYVTDDGGDADPKKIGFMAAEASLTLDTGPDPDNPVDPFVTVGGTFKVGGTSFLASDIGGVIGDTVYVRFRPYMLDGTPGSASESSSIAVVGVEEGDVMDEAITAVKIKAFSIEANNLSPSVGSSLDISANGSINLLVGETAALAQTSVDQQGAIDGLNADLVEVGTLASDASSVANDAQTIAGAAQAAADANTAIIEPLAQTYRFTSSGAFVGAPGSPYEFVIQNTGAAIRFNGTDVSTWDAQEMWVKQFRGDIVKLGNHQIEKYDTGTVVRAI